MGTSLPPSPPPQKRGGGCGTALPILAHVCCVQVVGSIEVKRGMKVVLGPGHTALDGDQLPLPKWHAPQFSAHVCCGQTAEWIKIPLGKEVDLNPGDIL